MATAGWISAVIDTVNFFSAPILSHLKKQYEYNAKLNDYNHRRDALVELRGSIQTTLDIQLRGPRKIARSDVQEWLTAADREISPPTVEDLVNQQGRLSLFYRIAILETRAANLDRIFDTGKIISQLSWLVDDDCTGVLNANMEIFKEWKEKLEGKLRDVRGRLRSQLLVPGKMETEEVKLWQRKGGEITGPTATHIEHQFNNVPHHVDFSNLVEEKSREMEKLLIDGALLPESLVVDDYSQTLGDDEMQSFEEWKEKLQGIHRDIKEKLSTELLDHDKIETEQVKLWLQKVEDIVGPAVTDVHNQLSSGRRPYHASLVARVKEMIPEMEKLCSEGYQLPESLVVNDYSQALGDDEVQSFKEGKEKLQGKYQDVERILRSQLGFGKIEKEQVKIWLKHVEETIASAADAQNQLSNGPPYMVSLVILVKKVYQKMEKLYGEGSQLPESLVIDDPSTSALELQTSALEGREAVKAKILAYLRGDEGTKLGVYGMGGVGKTTIMEHVYNQLLEESKFEKVIWITVSQTFDVRQIQQQIASSLNGSLPEHQNTVVRAATLSGMLGRHKPYVMILDDVWTSFELKDVGIPEPCVNDCCKFVLTTRSWGVVRQMRCDPFEVKVFSQEASLKLFKHVVGDVALLGDEGIKGTLELIVDECDGLPLAIKVVASSMRGISEPYQWRAALNKLRQSRRDDVFRTLKFSYDWLNDEIIQLCFLHCALYPEDWKIPKEKLVEYWIDEELIEVMETRQAMKDEGYAILKKLEENCLLELTRGWSERYGVCDCVRMHDLVRDMAISITKSSSPRFLVKAGVGLRELPEEDEWKEDLLKVSLMSNYVVEIPSSMPSPRCPMLTTLLLSDNSFSSIPELFFEHMPELKVLNLSHNHALESLPSSISKLVKLTTLLLQGCSSLKEVPSLSNLTNLKKLKLDGTRIKEVPDGLGNLIKLKYLDLCVSCMSNEAIAKWEISLSEILPNLSKLQYLRIHPRISVKGEVVGSLSKLEEFLGRFHSASDMSIFFKSRRVSLHRYDISVGRPSISFRAEEMKNICCGEIDMLRGVPNLLPSDVQSLFIERCNDVKSLNDVGGFQDITDLQECLIRRCEGIEYVFSWPNQHTAVRKKSAPPVGMFSSLERISISYCHKITKLFPSTVLLHLQNLKEIEVNCCKQLEEIFAVEEEEEDGESPRLTHLPKLEKLSLGDLPKLKSICGSSSRLICDSLETLTIRDCKELKRIPLHLPLLSPPRLKRIEVCTREWWESSEWDQPNAKDVLLPFCRFPRRR